MSIFKPEIRITGVIEMLPGEERHFRREAGGWEPEPVLPELVAALDRALRRAAEAELELTRLSREYGFCPWPRNGVS